MKKLVFLLTILAPLAAHAENPLPNRYVIKQEGTEFKNHVRSNNYANLEEVRFSEDYATPDETLVKKSVSVKSWSPEQPIKKFLNKIKIGESTQKDILALLSGPNIIERDHKTEQEKWVYSWLWSYDLRYPVEDSLIKMDHAGKRIVRGKNPVDLEILFDDSDKVTGVNMVLVKRGPEI